MKGVGTANLIPSMPPNIQHTWVQASRRHRVDTVRRAIHALNAQRVLVFMNFQSRLQVEAGSPKSSAHGLNLLAYRNIDLLQHYILECYRFDMCTSESIDVESCER